MAIDGVFLLLILPLGWMILGGIVAVGYIIWKEILGNARARANVWPFVFGHLGAGLGLLLLSCVEARLEFFEQVAYGRQDASDFWSYVPRMAVVLFVVCLPFVLVCLAVLGVPAVAVLIRMNRLNVGFLATLLVLGWPLLSVVLCWWATGDYRPRTFETFLEWLRYTPLSVLCVGGFFVTGVYWAFDPEKIVNSETVENRP